MSRWNSYANSDTGTISRGNWYIDKIVNVEIKQMKRCSYCENKCTGKWKGEKDCPFFKKSVFI